MSAKTFGSYSTNISFMHTLDPRTKLLIGLAFSISMFWILNPVQLLFACIFLVLSLVASKTKIVEFAASLLPAAILLVVLGLVNLCFTTSGVTLAVLGPIHITDVGLRAATLFPARVLIVLALTSTLLATTTPTQLTVAIDSLLSPLSKLKLPAHEIAFIFALMLRFIPILSADYRSISDALAARGARLREGSVAARLASLKAILIALIAAAIRHAQGLQRALDARSYVPAEPRTHYRSLSFTRNDALVSCIFVIYLVALTFASLRF